jgi:hypothetical protein
LPTGITRVVSKAILAGPDTLLLLGEAGARSVPLPSAVRR